MPKRAITPVEESMDLPETIRPECQAEFGEIAESLRELKTLQTNHMKHIVQEQKKLVFGQKQLTAKVSTIEQNGLLQVFAFAEKHPTAVKWILTVGAVFMAIGVLRLSVEQVKEIFGLLPGL